MERLLETDMAMKTGDDPDTVLDVLVADLTSSPTDRFTDRNPQHAHAPSAPIPYPLP